MNGDGGVKKKRRALSRTAVSINNTNENLITCGDEASGQVHQGREGQWRMVLGRHRV